MRYNEPIRFKGLSKDNIAFPISVNYSEYEQDIAEYEIISQDSTSHDIQAAMAEGNAMARGVAMGAASEAHKRAQNYPFGMYGITDFALSGSGMISTAIPFRFVNVENPNFFYNANDRTIYVNEAGFYCVQVFFYSTAVQGVNDYALSIETNAGTQNWGENYEPFIDYMNTNKHPSLKATTFINLPNQNEVANGRGYYGFRILIHGNMGFASFLNSNTKCALHVFKLSNLHESNRTIFPKQV